MLRVSPGRTVYLRAVLCAAAGLRAIGWIAASSWALETCNDWAADPTCGVVVLANAGLAVIEADKVIAAATPMRAGAAANGSRLEMANCVRLLRWRPKGLLLAEFALTEKAGRVTRCFARTCPTFGAPDITEA